MPFTRSGTSELNAVPVQEGGIQIESVIKLFDSRSVGEKFSLFDPSIFEEISKMKEKNIAVEILRKLMAEQQITRETTEENQSRTDWTKAWSTKCPILKTYQAEVDIPRYATQIRAMLTELQAIHGYSEQGAMLVLKDILAHECMDKKKGK